MLFGSVGSPKSSSLMNEYASLLSDAVLRHRARVAEHSARIEAELASKVKSEFIANMSHELMRPDRIELLQPLEQRVVLRQPARGPLVEVVVAVDRGRAWRACRGRRCGPRPRRPRARGPRRPRRSVAVADDDVAVRVLGALAVDGGDRAALDHEPGHRDARPSAPRRGSSRSPCSGTGCRPAPRGSRRPSASGLRRQQVVGGDDQPRRAEAALHRAGVQERLLHGVQLALAARAPRR